MTGARKEPIRFTRGRHFYQIAEDYRQGAGFIGLKDGRVVGRGDQPVTVMRTLIAAHANDLHH